MVWWKRRENWTWACPNIGCRKLSGNHHFCPLQLTPPFLVKPSLFVLEPSEIVGNHHASLTAGSADRGCCLCETPRGPPWQRFGWFGDWWDITWDCCQRIQDFQTIFSKYPTIPEYLPGWSKPPRRVVSDERNLDEGITWNPHFGKSLWLSPVRSLWTHSHCSKTRRVKCIK